SVTEREHMRAPVTQHRATSPSCDEPDTEDAQAGDLRVRREPGRHRALAAGDDRAHGGSLRRDRPGRAGGGPSRHRRPGAPRAGRARGSEGRGGARTRAGGGQMNISALFIRRPVMTTLVMLGIFVFGLMAYRLLPVSNLPNVDFPTITVSASLPGA